MKSQNKKIIEYLKRGNTITGLAALRLFGCFRLASRINDIKKMGYIIDSKFIKVNKKRIKKYWIEGV